MRSREADGAAWRDGMLQWEFVVDGEMRWCLLFLVYQLYVYFYIIISHTYLYKCVFCLITLNQIHFSKCVLSWLAHSVRGCWEFAEGPRGAAHTH